MTLLKGMIMIIDLFNKDVENAVCRYEETHGGSFFYQEPDGGILYENDKGDCYSFDYDITNEDFISLLESDSLNLSPCPPCPDDCVY